MSDIREQVMAALSTVIEPELHKDIVSLNMVRDLEIDGGTARFTIVLTTPACPLKDVFLKRCEEAVLGTVPGIEQLDIRWDSQVPVDRRIQGRLNAPMRSIIAVSSGKGGVGKSTVSVNLAVALAQEGAKVGLIDADILNPNVPQMMGLNTGRPKVVNNKMQPIEAYGVQIMSTGFLTSPDKPMIMRGPMLHSAIRQFFTDVNWDQLDYMVVDLPPGTGDAPLSLAQSFPLAGAIIVTQPQSVAVSDAIRAAAMFDQLDVPVLGIVENMTGEFFGSGGGEAFAQERGLTFLGRVPMAANVREGGDYGRPVVAVAPETAAGAAFAELAQRVAARTSVVMMQNADVIPINIIG
ncbi:Mrp/NBP35 family ATP-binding protein [Phototrophicus methaneseepsis]|uniref:Iron-sulfur cluster carrier protein n=1 Tax=Phototrophicus methaneseepsis TaxID=2710758 RepID=A0A7S8E600_9CHLR|nr:Mrp/NBP35 family ATP-binding protein [Phototrophicus methaneseepsis]QPC81017.1 Mrp/NBP35 family ATP-binding protein [Phototrophicus methaneseepsis]